MKQSVGKCKQINFKNMHCTVLCVLSVADEILATS